MTVSKIETAPPAVPVVTTIVGQMLWIQRYWKPVELAEGEAEPPPKQPELALVAHAHENGTVTVSALHPQGDWRPLVLEVFAADAVPEGVEVWAETSFRTQQPAVPYVAPTPEPVVTPPPVVATPPVVTTPPVATTSAPATPGK